MPEAVPAHLILGTRFGTFMTTFGRSRSLNSLHLKVAKASRLLVEAHAVELHAVIDQAEP